MFVFLLMYASYKGIKSLLRGVHVTTPVWCLFNRVLDYHAKSAVQTPLGKSDRIRSSEHRANLRHASSTSKLPMCSGSSLYSSSYILIMLRQRTGMNTECVALAQPEMRPLKTPQLQSQLLVDGNAPAICNDQQMQPQQRQATQSEGEPTRRSSPSVTTAASTRVGQARPNPLPRLT